MSNRLTTLIAASATTLFVCLAGTTTLLGGSNAAHACTPPAAPTPAVGGWPAHHPWDSDQVANAATILAVGHQLGVPPRGWIIALSTAMQESSLRNLPDGDRDSIGLFQQRPSQGWGTPEQLRDPAYATEAFYQHLLDVPDWQLLPLTEAAQAVQRSAHPDAYAKWEPDARELAAALTGTTPEMLALCGAGGWVRPLDGPVTSGYGPRGDHFHHGIDIPAPHGTVVRAAADGVVLRVRCNATLHGQPHTCDQDGGTRAQGYRGCGWYVDLQHAGGIMTRYCHLLTRPDLNDGDSVTAGQPIGLVGSSGSSSGPHLHFEIHVHGKPIDPLPFLAAIGVELVRSSPVGSQKTWPLLKTDVHDLSHGTHA
jgi:murein DD-endopeptidase MepM/ murein hydrolase activator NlpD